MAPPGTRPPTSFPGGQTTQPQAQPQGKPAGVKPISPVPVPAVPKVAAPAPPANAAAPPANAPSGPAASAVPEKTTTPAPATGIERTGTPATPNTTASTTTTTATPERKPALFISNVDNEPAIRDLFVEPEKSKIVKVEKWGKFNHVVTFANMDDARAAYEHLPAEHKKNVPVPPGTPRKPNVKWLEERPPHNRNQQHRGNNNTDRDASNRGSGEGGNAGIWQGSNRSAGARGSG
ncbi:hypothetical protein KEM56_005506, partial [Ascosphaera pollenicola]